MQVATLNMRLQAQMLLVRHVWPACATYDLGTGRDMNQIYEILCAHLSTLKANWIGLRPDLLIYRCSNFLVNILSVMEIMHL